MFASVFRYKRAGGGDDTARRSRLISTGWYAAGSQYGSAGADGELLYELRRRVGGSHRRRELAGRLAAVLQGPDVAVVPVERDDTPVRCVAVADVDGEDLVVGFSSSFALMLTIGVAASSRPPPSPSPSER